MSSVLHILSNSIKMIDSNTRNTFYKAISKFWAIYRNTKIINANIMFSLREIRNCLRKIKDDKSNADMALKIGGNFFDVVVSVAQKEYLAAFGSFIKVLDVSTHKKLLNSLFLLFFFFTNYIILIFFSAPLVRISCWRMVLRLDN
jgi:hypothetical protein